MGSDEETVGAVKDGLQGKTSPLSYDLPPRECAAAKIDELLDSTREKYANRAARFGEWSNRKVTDITVLGAHRTDVREGFVTGFDTLSTSELQKRGKRLIRFGEDMSESEDKLEARAKRFGFLARPTPEKHSLERRRDIALGETLRANVVHVFGVDEMSTKDVMSHFREFGPCWCEWLNDSSCNVAFEDGFTIRRVLHSGSYPNSGSGASGTTADGPNENMDDDPGAGTYVGVAGEGELHPDAKWRAAKPFVKRQVHAPLWVRQASEKDVRPARPNPKSRWSRTVLDQGAEYSPSSSRMPGESQPRVTLPGKHEPRIRKHGAATCLQEGKGSLGVRKTKETAIRKARNRRVVKTDLDRALIS